MGDALLERACKPWRETQGLMCGPVLVGVLGSAQAGGPAGGKDKRNMYLAKEGDVPRNSPAWMSMSEHDRWWPLLLRGAAVCALLV